MERWYYLSMDLVTVYYTDEEIKPENKPAGLTFISKSGNPIPASAVQMMVQFGKLPKGKYSVQRGVFPLPV